MWFLGQTANRIYVDDEHEDIYPDVLQQYYGTMSHGIYQQRHQTGAGNPPEEEDSGSDSDSDDLDETGDLGNHILEDQQYNVCHAPVDVPTHACPFP